MIIEPLHASCTEKEKLALDEEHASLLMSFCSQISSPDCSVCIIDMSNRTSRWIDLTGLSDYVRNNCSGI